MYGVGQIATGRSENRFRNPATIETAQSERAFQHGHFLNEVLVARAQNKSLCTSRISVAWDRPIPEPRT